MQLLFGAGSLLATLFVLRWLRGIPRTAGIAAGLVVAMLAIACAGIWLAEVGVRREQERLQAMVEGLGPTYAMELTRLGHAGLPDDVSGDDPRYLAMIEAQKRWLAINPAVADIYTFRRLADGSVILLVDSETDYDRDGDFEGDRESRTDPGEVYDEDDHELARAFEGEANFSPDPTTDRWGVWVSAYVPMRDAAGRVEAVLGIDYPAREWVRAGAAARAHVLVQTATMELVLLAAAIWVGLARRDSERRRLAEEELRAAYERVEHASRAKSDFLASISHEIRTPMNGVIGMTEMILATSPSAEHRRYAETILRSARHLLGLLNDLLDLSKAEAGHVLLDLQPARVADVVRESAEAFEGQARSKGIALELLAADDLPDALLVDPMRLRQVVMNLVGNAVKFTATGRVRVEVESLGPEGRAGQGDGAALRERIRIAVTDTGPGMPEAVRERVFEPFEQGDASVARRHGGSGLGLAISKRLVAQMGGAIGVESRVGEGSRFWITITAARAKDPDTSARAGALADRVSRPVAVLLVEDNPVNRAVARSFLELIGCRCEVARNGHEGVERAGKELYDLILMDVQMPGIDGTETARRLRARAGADSDHARVPIVAVTANATAEDRDACRAAGMDDYLSKPFTLEQIRTLVQRWVPHAFEAREDGADAPRAAGEIDGAVLDRLRELGRDSGADVLAEVSRAYRSASEASLASMRAALAAGDADAVARAAHGLKGSSAQIGAVRVATIAAEIEELARDGSLAGAAPAVARLERQLADACAELVRAEQRDA